jgi:hypothetical protein
VGTRFEGLEEKEAHREWLSTAAAVQAEGNCDGGLDRWSPAVSVES